MTRTDAYDCLLAAKRRETAHFIRLNRRREVRNAELRRVITQAHRRTFLAWVCGWINSLLGL